MIKTRTAHYNRLRLLVGIWGQDSEGPRAHRIDPTLVRADDFDAFYIARKTALLEMMEGVMGKAALRDGTGDANDYDMPDEDDLAAA